jgi:hypothetical protein
LLLQKVLHLSLLIFAHQRAFRLSCLKRVLLEVALSLNLPQDLLFFLKRRPIGLWLFWSQKVFIERVEST